MVSSFATSRVGRRVKVRALAVFRGRVQGVYFRAHCAEKAESLGLDGYVRNAADGSVEAVFEGERDAIEECVEWNKTAQPYARVESVQLTWSEPRADIRGFHVRH